MPTSAAGLAIYDVSKPAAPKLITKWMTAGKGVHRYDFDGRYAYISPTVEGYIGNIAMILDLDRSGEAGGGRALVDPRPVEGGRRGLSVGRRRRAALPSSAAHRRPALCQLLAPRPFILDISDMARAEGDRAQYQPGVSASDPYLPAGAAAAEGPRHHGGGGRGRGEAAALPPAFTWIYDITNERQPFPIATFQVPGLDKDGSPQPAMTGCHQPSERFKGTVIPFAWFAQGLRLVDIADPFAPKEVGSFLPDTPKGADRASSNDVTIDDRGLSIWSTASRGVDIIETNVMNEASA